MTVTMIGSRALKRWYPDAREPRGDWDYLCENHWQQPHQIDFPEPNRRRTDVIRDKRFAQYPCWTDLATPSEMYTLKISHGFWELHGTWNKHADDIRFLSRRGAEFKRKLYDIVLPIWKEQHKKNPVSLNKTKDGFFKDAVKRRYDHDSLHETVAYHERPLYESFLADGEQVKSDWAKFEALPLEVQLQAVREEVYATALERILIPRNYSGSPGAAYQWALRRTATSLFKNEWALFLLLHLDELWGADCDYIDRHMKNKSKLILLEG